MNEQIKAALESYLRNLLGVVLALVTTTMASAGVASPLDFGLGEWLTVANGLWAAAVPTLIRYVNKKDPAFGLVAETLAKGVTTKLETAAKAAPKAVPTAPAKKAPAKKAEPKK
jgi:type IV secretory pathway TrbD component